MIGTLAKRHPAAIQFCSCLFLLIALLGCSKSNLGLKDTPAITEESWRSNIIAPAEYIEALEQSSLIYLERDDNVQIPVRVFGEEGENYPVVFTHGLQSHSAWFSLSASLLAERGHPVYVFDRSGSGLSAAPRGDIKDFKLWAKEISEVAEYALARHGYDRHLLVGHCFGAIPATVYAYLYPGKVQALVLTTPAFYTRTSIPFSDILRIGFSKSGERDFLVPVMLQPELFSELDEYEVFIESDTLALRAATGDFYYQVNEARKFITRQVDLLKVPLFVALAGEDRIGDNRKNEKFFDKIPYPDKTLVTYEDARHILEYSPERQRFFTDLLNWLNERDEFVHH
ncbi:MULTISPECIES: alpha/beta fold hydrolase [Desulfosediminicola]|uniref:alpha/beta fold hydrolase n=1 Tax=Desulfosediminicola TaxID=2886823 RepID=UPI0010ABD6B3|nr:alpha/beta fold hydrolase [Desulfosediminicola ganghwensis]